MENKRILVTGGAGYIGSHICKLLARNNLTPVTLDNLTTGHEDAVKWGPLVVADVRDQAAVAKALTEYEVEAVMHFAASAYVGESVTDPAAYYDNNVGGMLSLLKACLAARVKKFILSSSCATYGMPDKMPIAEDTPQRPVNPYGWTKLICEQMLMDFDRAYGLRHVILRYFNAAGADPEGELSERHDPETHLIPLALMTAAGRREALGIFGTDYDTKDGTCIRDYIHVADLAEGHLAAYRYLEAGEDSLAVNLGSGAGLSVLEVVKAVERVTQRPVPTRNLPRRAGDPAILLADPSKAEKVIGFRAVRSDIQTMVQDAAPGFEQGHGDGQTG